MGRKLLPVNTPEFAETPRSKRRRLDRRSARSSRAGRTSSSSATADDAHREDAAAVTTAARGKKETGAQSQARNALKSQVIRFLSQSPLGAKEKQKLDFIMECKKRWLVKNEILFLLSNAENLALLQTECILKRPGSGTILIYDMSTGLEYKKDGWRWQLRKDHSGRVREDRAKLVIDRKITILGTYVHSADVPTFHRRSYSIRSAVPRYTIVHYLDEASKREVPFLREMTRIEDISLNREPRSIEDSFPLERKHDKCNATEKAQTSRSMNAKTSALLRNTDTKLCSCEDKSFFQAKVYDSTANPTLKSAKRRKDAHSELFMSFSPEKLDFFPDCLPKEPFTMLDSQDLELDTNQSMTFDKFGKIVDFSPNWDFIAGGAKILICTALESLWTLDNAIFVQFGPHVRVLAEHVAATVFRCTAPQATSVGNVQLYLCCVHPNNSQKYLQLTEKRVFHYRSDSNPVQEPIESCTSLESLSYTPSGAKRTRSLDQEMLAFCKAEQQNQFTHSFAENDAWNLSNFVDNDSLATVNERQCKIRVVERISEFHNAIQSTNEYANSNNQAIFPLLQEETFSDPIDQVKDSESNCKLVQIDDFEIETLSDRDIESLSEALLERVLQQLVSVAHTNQELMEELNSLDEAGLSLLHYVCFYNYARFVPLLISHGAQINQQSTQGQTALHLAAGCGYEDVVSALMHNEADLFLVDYSRLTAADRAEISGHSKMAHMLRSLMHANQTETSVQASAKVLTMPITPTIHPMPTLAAENRHHNRKLLLGAFSTMSLHDKCALSLGISRQEDKQDEIPYFGSNSHSIRGDMDASYISSCDADVKSVIANEEKHKLIAAMQLMDSEELQSLEDDAKVIQQNVRAWLLKRNYRRMRDTTRKLQEAANTIHNKQKRTEEKSRLQPLSLCTNDIECAAITIQAAVRAMIARKSFLQCKNVTIKVQAATRGALCRKTFSRMKCQALASLVIQRNVREWWIKQPYSRQFE